MSSDHCLEKCLYQTFEYGKKGGRTGSVQSSKCRAFIHILYFCCTFQKSYYTERAWRNIHMYTHKYVNIYIYYYCEEDNNNDNIVYYYNIMRVFWFITGYSGDDDVGHKIEFNCEIFYKLYYYTVKIIYTCTFHFR